MECLVLNKNFESILVLDSFESLIWTDRYNKYGDFEIYMPASIEIFDYLKEDYYLYNPDSEHMMIIEDTAIKSDSDDGDHLIINGRSLESLLYRRIIWKQTNLSGNFQNGLKQLIYDAIIDPEDESRKIPNFIFEESTDERITSLELEAQYTGDNLYDVISSNCIDKKIGFKIILNDDNQFVFSLYSGEDRSFSQDSNPFVIFSPNFENIINSDYKKTRNEYRNVTLIAGEGEGVDRKTSVIGNVSGIDRRELFTDARDISSKTDDGTLTNEQYIEKLNQRGIEELKKYEEDEVFEGKVETTQMFVYKKDFFIGDIVQLANGYGMEARSRISEMIFSQDENGESVYPTFEIVKDDEENEEEGGNE